MQERLAPIGELPVNTHATILIEIMEQTEDKTIARILPPYEGAAMLLFEINKKLLVKECE